MIEILIIADDQTGMLDTGAPFAQKGIHTEALMHVPTVEELRESDATVAVINTESRHIPPEKAYKRVYEIARIGAQAGVKILYKKTDSVLRGPVGAELAALGDALEGEVYFFPAYPKAGRITKDGIQYVNGVPISESAFRKDELNPVEESYIPGILQSTWELPVKLVGESQLKSWEPEKKRQIVVFDGENEEKFQQAVEYVTNKHSIQLVAGCAGLARELARSLPLTQKEMGNLPAMDKMFVLCGSSNPITRQQMDHGEKHGFLRYTLTREDLEGTQQIAAARKACQEGKSVILDMEYLSPEMLGITKEELGELVVSSLGQALIRCMDVLEGYVLFLTGGDTLSCFIRKSGCQRIEVKGELSPGIAVNVLHIGDRELYAVSKSGGYGSQEILEDLKEGKI